MPSIIPTILITGDICIDWLQFPTYLKDQGLNWELYPSTRMTAKNGGALLLAKFQPGSIEAAIVSPQLENIENIPPVEILPSNAERPFPYSSDPQDKNNRVYRIWHCMGHMTNNRLTRSLATSKTTTMTQTS